MSKLGTFALAGAAAIAASAMAGMVLAASAAPSGNPGCAAGERQALRTNGRAYGALVRRSARVYREPNGRLIARFGGINANGYPMVFGVLARIVDRKCNALWYHVQLPMRPNGKTGYVRPWAVRVQAVGSRIVVDLSSRLVLVYRNGRLRLRALAAIGAPRTPTPTGHYYVNQRLVPSYPSGPFGAGALGISAFSDVLTYWAQGGPVAIHGTNQPWLLGQRVSNGCVRVTNAAVRRLFALAPAGTPVLIRA